MKNLSLLFLLCCLSFSAQTTRILYRVEIKNNSSAQANPEDYLLEINGNEAQFFAKKDLRTDSLHRAMPGSSISYSFKIPRLKREVGSSDNLNYEYLSSAYWKYPSNEKPNWQLGTETKPFGQWTVQKATADFLGRKWTAWFTRESPMTEGPYKFNGLPGLVTEVYDDQNHYHFTLQKIMALKEGKPQLLEELFREKPFLVTWKDIQQKKMDDYTDPYRQFRRMEPGTWSIKIGNEEFNTEDGLLKATRSQQEKIRQHNNPLELDKKIDFK